MGIADDREDEIGGYESVLMYRSYVRHPDDETRRIIADTFPESYEQFEQDAEGDFDEDDTDESAGML